MQTSGLILDVYDDYRGDTIRSLFPSRSEIPGLVKQAHALSAETRDQLPDETFALVLLNGEEKLRKFACTDPGNTALSVLFFLKNGHKLPEEAQKVAAANLQVACDWYELPVVGLEKVALLGWAARTAVEHPWTAFNMAMVAPEALHEAKANLHAVSDIEHSRGERLGGMPISPDQIKEYRKQASMGHLVKGHASEADTSNFGPEETEKYDGYTKGWQPKTNPQTNIKPKADADREPKTEGQKSASFQPYVDVTTLEAKGETSTKAASVYALEGRYPLDSFEQVKTASSYFEEFKKSFEPEERREYCSNLLKRAEALDIQVSEEVRHYGGEDFATPDMLKAAHDLRSYVLEDEDHRSLLGALFEKAAELGPELFCETLSEFDKIAGLNYLYDKDIPDPYYSTFYKAAEQEYSFISGNETVTADALRDLAKVGPRALKKSFGEDFVEEFQKDPVSIFKSLPIDQKKMVMRMANENSAPGIALLA